MSEYVYDFTAAREGQSHSYCVSADKFYTATIRGENWRLHVDTNPYVGEIIEHASNLYSAAYHRTVESPDRYRIGMLKEIPGFFASLDDAVSAIRNHYDPALDDFGD